MVTYEAIVFTLQLLFFAATPIPLLDEGNCNWKGSGDPRDDKSILLLHSYCKQGSIKWDKPHGGMRILIQPKFVRGDFEVCFKSYFQGVNVYTEHGDKLRLIQDYNKSNRNHQKCFKSYKKNAVLYIENEKKRNQRVEIEYTTNMENEQIKYEKPRECKPCNNDQIIESICKGDFVVRGYIRNYITLSDGITAQENIAQANITAKEIISQKGTFSPKTLKTLISTHWVQSKCRRRVVGSTGMPTFIYLLAWLYLDKDQC